MSFLKLLFFLLAGFSQLYLGFTLIFVSIWKVCECLCFKVAFSRITSYLTFFIYLYVPHFNYYKNNFDLAVQAIPLFETAFTRCTIILILSYLWLRRSEQPLFGTSHVRKILLGRTLIGFISLSSFIYW